MIHDEHEQICIILENKNQTEFLQVILIMTMSLATLKD